MPRSWIVPRCSVPPAELALMWWLFSVRCSKACDAACLLCAALMVIPALSVAAPPRASSCPKSHFGSVSCASASPLRLDLIT